MSLLIETAKVIDRIAPGKADEIIEGYGVRNTVRIVVHRVGMKNGELITDSRIEPTKHMSTSYELFRKDMLRASVGLKPRYLKSLYSDYGIDYRDISTNLRVNSGTTFVPAQIAGSPSTTPAIYLALTNNTTTPAVTDAHSTTSSGICWGTNTTSDAAASSTRGEYNFGGLARASGTYAYTATNTFYTLSKTWTASAVATALQAIGCFGNATNQVGPLAFENTFTPTTLAISDQLGALWTFNF